MSRMKILLATVGAASTLAIALAALPSLSQQAHGDAGATTPPSKDAAAVLKEAKNYRSWTRFKETEPPIRSEGHDDMWVVAWHNAVVGGAAKSPAKELPDGSIIVKENRPQPDAAPMATTIMAKQGGEWFWIKATPDLQRVMVEDGKPLAGKKVSSCVGCHSQADNDMVFTRDFSKR